MKHLGRFVDSSTVTSYFGTNETQKGASITRTIRAKGMRIDRANNRVLVRMGEYLGVYRGGVSAFLQRVARGPLRSVRSQHRKGTPERYLQWNAAVDPESDYGWVTATIDGLDRLWDFDWDGRGYLYVAYGVWGWGIVDENLRLVHQSLTSAPAAIRYFTHAGRHYIVVGTSNEAAIWDVTDPTSPTQVREFSNVWNIVTTPVNVAISHSRGVDLYTPYGLLRGVAEVKISGEKPSIDAAGGRIHVVTVDHRNERSTLHAFDGEFSSKPFNGYFIEGVRVGENGAIAIWGMSSRAREKVVFLIRGDEVTELSDWYQANYVGKGPYVGFEGEAEILPVSDGGKQYVIASCGGYGDVWEMGAAADPVDPKPEPPKPEPPRPKPPEPPKTINVKKIRALAQEILDETEGAD